MFTKRHVHIGFHLPGKVLVPTQHPVVPVSSEQAAPELDSTHLAYSLSSGVPCGSCFGRTMYTEECIVISLVAESRLWTRERKEAC